MVGGQLVVIYDSFFVRCQLKDFIILLFYFGKFLKEVMRFNVILYFCFLRLMEILEINSLLLIEIKEILIFFLLILQGFFDNVEWYVYVVSQCLLWSGVIVYMYRKGLYKVSFKFSQLNSILFGVFFVLGLCNLWVYFCIIVL